MANVRVTLTHPTTRADGSNLPLAEIKHVILETKAAAATGWTPVGAPILPADPPRVVQNVSGGAWDYRATWVDTQDRVSAPAQGTISVPIGAPNAGTITLAIV